MTAVQRGEWLLAGRGGKLPQAALTQEASFELLRILRNSYWNWLESYSLRYSKYLAV